MKINNNFQYPKNMQSTPIKNNRPAFSGAMHTLGDKIIKSNTLQKAGKILEFDGYNMPLASLVTVCYGGVLIPRLVCARDKNEFKEIMVRDVTSMAALLFGRKAIQNVVSKACSKVSGLALVRLPQNHKNPLQVMYNYLRPEKGVSVMNSSELISKYTNIDTFKNGIVDFCDFVNKSGGNVAKIFKSDEKLANIAKKAYEKSGATNDFADATSEQLTQAFTKLHNTDKSSLNEIYTYFKDAKNPILKKARVMNSSFDCLATFVLVPGFLGFGLPKLTEKDIKSKYKKNNDNVKNISTNAKNSETQHTLNSVYLTRSGAKSNATFKDFV